MTDISAERVARLYGELVRDSDGALCDEVLKVMRQGDELSYRGRGPDLPRSAAQPGEWWRLAKKRTAGSGAKSRRVH